MAVAYTLNTRDKTNAGKKLNGITIAYTTEAYSSGLSFDKAQFGMPNSLEALSIVEAESNAGSIFKVDMANSKIRIYRESAGSYAEASGNQTVTISVFAIGW